MKIERRDASHEKRILSAMITDSTVLARISPQWVRPGLFRSKWANLIGGWAVKFHERHDKAPGRLIESLFEKWADGNKDNATQDLVESFLSSLSDEYEKQVPASSDYLIDLAATHFNRIKKERFIADLQADLTAGDDAKADSRFAEYNRIELGVGAGIDVLHDRNAMKAAFETTAEDMITYPDALGTFFNGQLVRDAFIAFVGSAGRGKTFWLMDLAWRGMQQGRRVAFISVGDMSESQVMRRFGIRAARRPLRAGPVKYPVGLQCKPKSRRADPNHITRKFKKPLNWKTAWAACEKLVGDRKSADSLLRMSCHPNMTISGTGVAALLDSWERVGWVPDVVIIDYADLLMPISGREHWEKADLTWRYLRGLSQARHCLLITANQADADALKADTVRMQNFSKTIGVSQHTTGLIGLSQTEKEKGFGVMRLNWLKSRDTEFDTTAPCHVAGCLAIANPAVLSIF